MSKRSFEVFSDEPMKKRFREETKGEMEDDVQVCEETKGEMEDDVQVCEHDLPGYWEGIGKCLKCYNDDPDKCDRCDAPLNAEFRAFHYPNREGCPECWKSEEKRAHLHLNS